MFKSSDSSSKTQSSSQLVDLVALDDLANTLKKMEQNQTALLQQQQLMLEQQKLALEQQRLVLEQQKLLVEQEKILAASAIRNEFRACGLWRPLPLLNGDPLPENIEFPGSAWDIRSWKKDKLIPLAQAYGIPGTNEEYHRQCLLSFLRGHNSSA